MQVAVVVAVYSIFSVFELISIKKDGDKKAVLIFIFLITLSFVFSILISLDINVPSVNKIVGDWILSFYK